MPPLAALAVMLLPPPPASAAEPQAVQIEYQAGPGCPTEADFLREIRARTARVRVVHGPGGGRAFRASIAPSGQAQVGRLEVVDPDGKQDVREIRGHDCAETASALALMVAVAVDPEASLAPVSAPAVPSDSPPLPSATPTILAPLPATSAGSGWTPPAGPSSNQRLSPVSADSGVRRGNVAASVGMGPWFSAGMAPQICFGGQIFFQIASTPQVVATRSIRIGFGLLDNGPFGGRQRTAAFRWTGGRVSACPLELAGGRSWSLSPCPVLDVGVLEGSGRAVAHPKTRTSAWLSAGLSGRLTWWSARGWFVETEVAGMIAISQPTFVFEHPRIELYRVPLVDATLGVAAGMRLF